VLVVTSTSIEGIKILTPGAFEDARGTFTETYNRNRFSEHGIPLEFVQDNQSSSVGAGTIRGLHFQRAPVAQHKLIRVLRGSIFDVAVDLRRSSPTYGKWVAERLSARNGKQVFVPIGFAHGFCTLEPDTHVLYKVSDYYSPVNEMGIAWDDPDLAIDWPISSSRVILSERDARLPSFKSLPTYFE